MVFVTGGTGFLGAYIIRELIEKGYRVRALRRSSRPPLYISKEIFQQVEWVDGDILDVVALNQAMDGAMQVIHSAAKVSFHPREKEIVFKTNIEGTANVVNAAIEHDIKRFVHVSSVAALGRNSNGSPIDESTRPEPSSLTSNYAISKYYAEMEVWRGMAEGLPAVVVNPSTILGYGDWNTTSCIIFKALYRGFPWYSHGVNGFVDVRDVAAVAVKLMESHIVAERFVLNSDNWSFKQLFHSIATHFNKTPPSRVVVPWMASLAWRYEKLKSLLSGSEPLVTRESALIAMSKAYYSNSKILQTLAGFSFTPLGQTIQEACENYSKHNGSQSFVK